MNGAAWPRPMASWARRWRSIIRRTAEPGIPACDNCRAAADRPDDGFAAAPSLRPGRGHVLVTVRTRRRASATRARAAARAATVHLVHRADVDGRHRARRRRADRRAVGDERLPGRAAHRILSVASHIEIRGLPALADDAGGRADGAREPAREGGRAVRAGAGDALGRRDEPRRAHPRHRSGPRERRWPTSAATCARARSPTSSPASSASSSAASSRARSACGLGDTVVVITPQGT